jgi:hypothetical protein
MFSELSFTLEYDNLEIEKSDLDEPLVKLNYKLNLESGNKATDLYIDIESIKYFVKLQSSDSDCSSFVNELSIGESSSPKRLFVKVGTPEPVFFYFPLRTKVLSKVTDIMMKSRLVVLQISAEIYGKVYQFQNSFYNLKDILKRLEPIKHHHLHQIILPNQDIHRLIKDAEYPQKLKIEIPLYNYNPNVNSSINGAVSSLQSASKELEKGNFHGVLINTRNAITNHLTELIEEKENKRIRILKKQLKSDFLDRAPTDAYKIYENTIDSLEKGLGSTLDIINKFVHEDNNKLKMIPMHEDLELTYFSVVLITSYLARRLSI